MSISATHSPRKRTRRRTKYSTITIVDMIMIMLNRARKKMTSWVIYIQGGNLDVNSEICRIEIALFAITYAYVCSKVMKHIPLHFTTAVCYFILFVNK